MAMIIIYDQPSGDPGTWMVSQLVNSLATQASPHLLMDTGIE